MYVTSLSDNFFAQIMTETVKLSKRTGTTVKDTRYYEGLYEGTLSGIRLALAAYAGEMRIEKLKSLGIDKEDGRDILVPVPYEHDFINYLKEIRSEWDEGAWGGKSDEEFFDSARMRYEEIVFDSNFMDTYHALRKKAIFAGVIEPTDEDRGWIEEEYQIFAATAKPYEALMQKIGPSQAVLSKDDDA